MNITKKVEGDQLFVALEGRLDTITAPELEGELNGATGNAKDIVFDFSNLEYISSAGLRVLLKAKKALFGKGTVKIVNANDIVKEVFEVTGFNELLDVE